MSMLAFFLALFVVLRAYAPLPIGVIEVGGKAQLRAKEREANKKRKDTAESYNMMTHSPLPKVSINLLEQETPHRRKGCSASCIFSLAHALTNGPPSLAPLSAPHLTMSRVSFLAYRVSSADDLLFLALALRR
jgi:hypothetical protein